MSALERVRLEEMIELFLETRKKLGSDGSFRVRVLLDMVLLELGKELAKSDDKPAG